MIGLLLLKHIYGLSDEGACERRVCDHYFQCFTYEEFFQHQPRAIGRSGSVASSVG